MNILIVGKEAAAFALAKKLKSENTVKNVYITASYNFGEDFACKCVNIGEDDLTELLKFVLENEIDLTVAIGEKALNSDIVLFFEANGQGIFAPDKHICAMFSNRVSKRKFLYRLNVPMPKFAVYNKLQQAKLYLERAKYPLIVQSVHPSRLNDDRMICNNFSAVSDFFNYLQQRGEYDVLFEEFLYGKSFTGYYVTDGYSALPLGIVGNYKFKSAQYAFLTEGMGSYAPCFSLPEHIENCLNEIANSVIFDFEQREMPYTGIFGIEGILTPDGDFVVSDIHPFLQNHNAGVVLNGCEDNLSEVFMSCANGYFSDEYSRIRTNNRSRVSLVVCAKRDGEEIKNLAEIIDYVDFINIKTLETGKYHTLRGECFTLTSGKATLTSARKALGEYLDEIDCACLEYRSDILNPISEFTM